jgi:hypothetical protein
MTMYHRSPLILVVIDWVRNCGQRPAHTIYGFDSWDEDRKAITTAGEWRELQSAGTVGAALRRDVSLPIARNVEAYLVYARFRHRSRRIPHKAQTSCVTKTS